MKYILAVLWTYALYRAVGEVKDFFERRKLRRQMFSNVHHRAVAFDAVCNRFLSDPAIERANALLEEANKRVTERDHTDKETKEFSLTWKDTSTLPVLPEGAPYVPVLVHRHNDGDNVRVAKFTRYQLSGGECFVIDDRDVPTSAISHWAELTPTAQQEQELKRGIKNSKIRSNALLAIDNLNAFSVAYSEVESDLDISELNNARRCLEEQLRRYNGSTLVPVTEEDVHFAQLGYWTYEVNSLLSAAEVMLHSGTRNTN